MLCETRVTQSTPAMRAKWIKKAARMSASTLKDARLRRAVRHLQAAVPTEIVKVDVVCNCTAKGADLRFSIVVGESACTVGANQATRKSLWSP